MSEPSIDPGVLAKAVDWLWAGVLGLVGIIYKANEKKLQQIDEKIDHEVRCARVEIKGKADSSDLRNALKHIETLFENAERDRKETRELITTIDHRAQDTLRLVQADIMKAIAEIGANGRKR